jgi:excisionase family DNA binding protein
MMTKLITIPKFAEATGLPYRLCLHLVGTGQIPYVAVGRRHRIDVRWVEQWLASGGYRPGRGRARATGVERDHQIKSEMLTAAE